MNAKKRVVLEGVLFVTIIGVSVVIFLMRNAIQDVGNIGYLGVFFLCFLANATVLLPAPSLAVAASCALIMNPYLVSLFSSLGSTTGELVGYLFGSLTTDLSPKMKLLIKKIMAKVKNETILVFIFAVLPLPLFDVVGIYSGGAKINLIKFYFVCFMGKFIKMLFYTRIIDLFNVMSISTI